MYEDTTGTRLSKRTIAVDVRIIMDDGVLVRLLLVKVVVCAALRDGPELSGIAWSIILGTVGGSVSERVACVSTLPCKMLSSCCSETTGLPVLW